VLDRIRRRAESDARDSVNAKPDNADAGDTIDDLAGSADADREARQHPRPDPAASSAACGDGAVRARRDEQRSVHDDAGHAQQHDLRRGRRSDAGHAAAARGACSEFQRQCDAWSACELASSKYRPSAEYDESSIANVVYAAAGNVAGVSGADDRRKRRGRECDPAALHAGYGPGLDDDAAGDAQYAVDVTGHTGGALDCSALAKQAGGARDDSAGHVQSAGDPEPLAKENFMWVRRLWPEERETVKQPAGADPESHGASHDVKSPAGQVRVRAREWVTLRWPCWPVESTKYKAKSEK